jgi:hypothetical protein
MRFCGGIWRVDRIERSMARGFSRSPRNREIGKRFSFPLNFSKDPRVFGWTRGKFRILIVGFYRSLLP